MDTRRPMRACRNTGGNMGAGRLEGLIPLAGGVIAYLIYLGVIPMKGIEGFKQRYGAAIQLAALICVVYGTLRLFGMVGR